MSIRIASIKEQFFRSHMLANPRMKPTLLWANFMKRCSKERSVLELGDLPTGADSDFLDQSSGVEVFAILVGLLRTQDPLKVRDFLFNALAFGFL